MGSKNLRWYRLIVILHMEVVRSNFEDMIPLIKDAIANCAFIAFDTELTGKFGCKRLLILSNKVWIRLLKREAKYTIQWKTDIRK